MTLRYGLFAMRRMVLAAAVCAGTASAEVELRCSAFLSIYELTDDLQERFPVRSTRGVGCPATYGCGRAAGLQSVAGGTAPGCPILSGRRMGYTKVGWNDTLPCAAAPAEPRRSHSAVRSRLDHIRGEPSWAAPGLSGCRSPCRPCRAWGAVGEGADGGLVVSACQRAESDAVHTCNELIVGVLFTVEMPMTHAAILVLAKQPRRRTSDDVD